MACDIGPDKCVGVNEFAHDNILRPSALMCSVNWPGCRCPWCWMLDSVFSCSLCSFIFCFTSNFSMNLVAPCSCFMSNKLQVLTQINFAITEKFSGIWLGELSVQYYVYYTLMWRGTVTRRPVERSLTKPTKTVKTVAGYSVVFQKVTCKDITLHQHNTWELIITTKQGFYPPAIIQSGDI